MLFGFDVGNQIRSREGFLILNHDYHTCGKSEECKTLL